MTRHRSYAFAGLITAIALIVGSCGDDTTEVGSDPGNEPVSQSNDDAPADDFADGDTESPRSATSSFTLHVSNQSFDDSTVHITITIDDEVAVDQNFEVGDQHNVVTFEPDIGPGEHTLIATSNTGAVSTVKFATAADEPRWASVSYWWYPDEVAPRRFTFDISDEEMAFG